MTNRVTEILNGFWGENTGVLTHLAGMLNHGKLAGMGKMIIMMLARFTRFHVRKWPTEGSIVLSMFND